MNCFKSSKIFIFLLFINIVCGHEIAKARVARQAWQWPSGFDSSAGRSGFSRSDNADSNSGFFPNIFKQNFISSSPFASFSFQPSFANIFENFPTSSGSAIPAISSGSAGSGDVFSMLADKFGSRQQPSSPKVDNFFTAVAPSWTNISPQQRPISKAVFSSAPVSGAIFPSSQTPMKFEIPANFPSQNWDGSGATAISSASDLQSQINNLFKQNGMWSLPQNFVQDKINEAWTKSTQQFGSSTGNIPVAGFSSLQFGSPGSQSDMFAGTQPASLTIAKNAFTLEDFSKSLSKQLNFNRSTAASALPLVTIAPASAAAAPTAPTAVESEDSFQPVATPAPSSPPATSSFPDCQGQEQPVVPISDFLKPERQPACAKNKYRSHTGECNNICFPNRGKASTVFIRLVGPDYADGISEPRRNSRNQPLPSARLVSSSLIGTKVRLAPTWTNMFMQFGQFLDHDITQTPRAQLSDDAPQCCGANNPHPQCLSIDIPKNDPFYSQFGQTCMEFVRSLPGIRPGCRLGAREQMNQQTAFIDASQIYGVRQKDVDVLREFSGGRLKTFSPFSNNPSYTLLPAAATDTTCVDGSEDKPCFVAGDNRCNVQVGLQTMHTVWMRHHNQLVARLAHLNPNWDDEKLYQEARAIIAAQLQHITYNEWLPMLLGENAIDQMGLRLLSSGRFNAYNVTIHPGLINEFSAAALRMGHSMVPGTFNRLTSNFGLKSSVKVRDTFFKSNLLYEEGAVDELVRGLAQQKGKVIENSVTADLSQQLFASAPSSFGLDLVSLNIQRGRDHGLTGYMKWRKLCGLATVDNFNDLKSLNALPDETINRLASVYETVDDIDLYPAGISEFAVGDAIVGPTFACIISEQFWRLRVADRFWYENGLPLASTLKDGQLAEIRRTTLSRILCDNVAGLQSIQANVFDTVSSSNPRVPCSKIPTVSLKSWTGV